MYFGQYPNHPYWGNASVRGQEENVYKVVNVLLNGLKREAELCELYRQLTHMAPDENHKRDLLQAFESKKAQLNQLTQLYVQLTGILPVYQVNRITFNSYNEGLQQAYEAEARGYENYLQRFSSIHHPLIQNVLLWAINGERENVSRLRYLSEDRMTDYGGKPFVIDMNMATKQNDTFRTAFWTSKHLQVTLMSINMGEDIGLENHPNLDQFLRVEEGQGLVQMGKRKDRLDFQEQVSDDYAILIPANTWHNVINSGNIPLKLYSIYAPPQHPFGTVHETKDEAMAAEKE